MELSVGTYPVVHIGDATSQQVITSRRQFNQFAKQVRTRTSQDEDSFVILEIRVGKEVVAMGPGVAICIENSKHVVFSVQAADKKIVAGQIDIRRFGNLEFKITSITKNS